jgi:hypothetical protein
MVAKGAGAMAVAMMVALVFSGCQTPGKLVDTEECPTCPYCKAETRTAPIKGMTYTKVVCPECRKVGNPGTWAELRDRKTTYVCDKCKVVVSKCAACAGK